MKSDVRTAIVQMDRELLKNLVKEVKETVASDYPMPKNKKPTFGAIDMWKIRRNARTAQGRFSR